MPRCHSVTGEPLLTQREAAVALGVAPWDVLDLADAGCLAWEPADGMRWYTQSSVQAHAARMSVPAPAFGLQPGQAASILRVDTKTVAAWARAGKLSCDETRGRRWYSEPEVRALREQLDRQQSASPLGTGDAGGQG